MQDKDNEIGLEFCVTADGVAGMLRSNADRANEMPFFIRAGCPDGKIVDGTVWDPEEAINYKWKMDFLNTTVEAGWLKVSRLVMNPTSTFKLHFSCGDGIDMQLALGRTVDDVLWSRERRPNWSIDRCWTRYNSVFCTSEASFLFMLNRGWQQKKIRVEGFVQTRANTATVAGAGVVCGMTPTTSVVRNPVDDDKKKQNCTPAVTYNVLFDGLCEEDRVALAKLPFLDLNWNVDVDGFIVPMSKHVPVYLDDPKKVAFTIKTDVPILITVKHRDRPAWMVSVPYSEKTSSPGLSVVVASLESGIDEKHIVSSKMSATETTVAPSDPKESAKSMTASTTMGSETVAAKKESPSVTLPDPKTDEQGVKMQLIVSPLGKTLVGDDAMTRFLQSGCDEKSNVWTVKNILDPVVASILFRQAVEKEYLCLVPVPPRFRVGPKGNDKRNENQLLHGPMHYFLSMCHQFGNVSLDAVRQQVAAAVLRESAYGVQMYHMVLAHYDEYLQLALEHDFVVPF